MRQALNKTIKKVIFQKLVELHVLLLPDAGGDETCPDGC